MVRRRMPWMAVVVLLCAFGAGAQPAVPLGPERGANTSVSVLPPDRFTPAPPEPQAPPVADLPRTAEAVPAPEPAVEAAAASLEPSIQAAPAAVDAEAPAGEVLAADRPLPRRGGQPGADEARPLGPASASLTASDWIKTLAALAIVLALIFGLRLLLRRVGGGAAGGAARGAIEVLARTPVTPKHQVLLLRVGQRIWLVGAGSNGLSRLGEISEPEQVAELLGAVERGRSTSPSASFASALRGWREEIDIGDPVPDEPAEPPTPAAATTRQVKAMLGRLRRMATGGRAS